MKLVYQHTGLRNHGGKQTPEVTHPFVLDPIIIIPPIIAEELGNGVNLFRVFRGVGKMKQCQQSVAVGSKARVSLAGVSAKVCISLEGLDHAVGTDGLPEYGEGGDCLCRVIDIWLKKRCYSVGVLRHDLANERG